MGHYFVDQAYALRLVGIDEISGHQKLLGLGHADEQGPDHRASISSNEPGTDMGVADPCPVRGVDDVGEQGDGGAEAGRHPVKGADYGLLHP